jgi:DNA-directed RNA polymerase specialized sigma24 family protein
MDPPPNVTFGTKVDPTRLPSGYGRSFGQRVYKMLLMKAKDPELVQEILSQLLLRISDGRVQPRAGVELREAESFIFKITHNLLVDAIRSGRSRREESMDAVHGRRRWKDPDVDVAIDIDINDTTDAFQALDNLLPRHVVKGILDDLSKINKRAPEWFLAKLDGLTDQELAEVWGMDRSYPHQWLKKHQPRIEKVIQRHI